MDEIRPEPSPPPPLEPSTAATAATSTKTKERSATSRMRKDCLCFAASVQESLRYVKAMFVGQAKKLTARTEKEAAEADLQASKMQVEAADEAESTKKKLDKTM